MDMTKNKKSPGLTQIEVKY